MAIVSSVLLVLDLSVRIPKILEPPVEELNTSSHCGAVSVEVYM